MFFMITGILFYIYSWGNQKYIEDKQKQYAPKIENVTAIMETEKSWIGDNIGQDGEIYLNNANNTGDVNPYFACFAALGLLSGTPSSLQLVQVQNYLNWQTSQIIQYEGEVGNYGLKDQQLVVTGTYDSVDSYLGLYLILLCEYAEKGGSLSSIEGYESAIKISLKELASITKDGLTAVSEDAQIYYLMDNAEVYSAYEKLNNLLLSENETIDSITDADQILQQTEEAAISTQNAVETSLWNEEEKHFEVGLDEFGNTLEYSGWDRFYPDAIVQVYPAAFGVTEIDQQQRELYQELCSYYNWENFDVNDDVSDWTVMAYIAIKMDDIERAEIFLDGYAEKYKNKREYPLHTGEAGWVARACEDLNIYYVKQAQSSILSDLLYELQKRIESIWE